MTEKKSFYTLLRFEYKKDKKLHELELFKSNKSPIPGSQDTWIYHTKFQPNGLLLEKADILLGKPGCDNTLAYLLHIHGYSCINEPFHVRTYHMHLSNVRNYTMGKDTIKDITLFIPKSPSKIIIIING